MEIYSFISWLLYSSLMGSILVGMIIIVRLVLKNRMNANWQYLIWFLLIFKLLIPYAPESSFSVFNFFTHINIENLVVDYFDRQDNEKTDQNKEKSSSITNIINVTDDYSLSIDRKFLNSRESAVFVVWFMGVVGLTVYTTHLTFRLKRLIKASLVVNDNPTIKLLEECKLMLSIKGNIMLIESPTIRLFLRLPRQPYRLN